MGRRFLYIVLLVVGGLFLYLGYNSYDAKRAGVSGMYSPMGKMKPKRAVTTQAPEQTVVYPSAATITTAPVTSAETTQSGTQPAQDVALDGDTISSNPPNGMKFSGSGRYQLYRQGNITWRMDTETGKTCIIFATDEEWKRPQVYRNGCGKR